MALFDDASSKARNSLCLTVFLYFALGSWGQSFKLNDFDYFSGEEPAAIQSSGAPGLYHFKPKSTMSLSCFCDILHLVTLLLVSLLVGKQNS